MALKKLRDLLHNNHIPYETIAHSPTYTAAETAQSAHIPGKLFAKPVIVKLDGKLAMIVLTANKKVDLEHLKLDLGAREAKVASELEFQDAFPDCEVGAMPPFGELFNLDTYMDRDLAKDKSIMFNAGTHSELIKLASNDFKKIVHAREISL